MFPQRPSGTSAHAPARKSGIVSQPVPQTFEAIKGRVIARLEDRLNPAASKRMPSSILRQSLRTYAEQVVEQEGSRLSKVDRERLADEVLAELLGYGPLDELFQDEAVREVMVAGPQAVLARRDTAGWLPMNVRFRDEAHLRTALDRLATHADPVGAVTASVNVFDLKLPNGFRAIAVIPPEALGQSPTVAFVRMEANPPTLAAEMPVAGSLSGRQLHSATTRSTPGSGSVAAASSVRATHSASSAFSHTPQQRPSPLELTPSAERDPLLRYRHLIMEQLMKKLASHGVYDLQRVETGELRRLIAAFISEYCDKERIYLSDTDQGRLLLEILTAMHR